MPYIKQDRRSDFRRAVGLPIKTSGELNYQFTAQILNYLEGRELSYQLINDIVGALEGAKLEFYRRVVAPYEDKKIQENGDVY